MRLIRSKKYFFIFLFLICFVFIFYIARAQEEALFQERVEVFEPLPQELIKHLPSDINQQIAYFVKYFSTEKREVTERWFRRCGPVLPYFKMIFKEEGLPEDLVYLAMIESGCNPFAVSRAGAVGIWQFMEGTARSYGLRIDFWEDERRDFLASTRAAAKYLKRLYQIFNDWRVAVASYNAGEGRVLRGLKTKNFADYWRAMMSGAFPLETFAYVPQWLAITILAKNPEKYNLPPLESKPFDLDEVEVPGGFELKSLAQASGMDAELFFFLNAKYRRGFLPPQKSSKVWVLYENKHTLLKNIYSLPWAEVKVEHNGEKIVLYTLNEEAAKKVLQEAPKSPSHSKKKK